MGHGVPKNETESANWFRKAEKYDGPLAANDLAWRLATCSDAELRDGAKAVEYAEQAVMGTKRNNPAFLDTLACAYAENGRFEKAVATEEEAIKLLHADQRLAECELHRALFRAGKPYRQ